jgi:hypothetical protein
VNSVDAQPAAHLEQLTESGEDARNPEREHNGRQIGKIGKRIHDRWEYTRIRSKASAKLVLCWFNFGFWRGVDIPDPQAILEGGGDKIRHVKLASVKDIRKKAFQDMIKAAGQLNRVRFGPSPRPSRLYF